MSDPSYQNGNLPIAAVYDFASIRSLAQTIDPGKDRQALRLDAATGRAVTTERPGNCAELKAGIPERCPEDWGIIDGGGGHIYISRSGL